MPRDVPLHVLLRHVHKSDHCWIWTGHLDPKGYGRFGGLLAHRLMYRATVGPIPGDLTVDHLCFVPRCVRPEHLRLLPRSANSANQRSAMKTHCSQGHEFTVENTYIRPRKYGSGRRTCRTCQRQAVARYKTRRSA